MTGEPIVSAPPTLPASRARRAATFVLVHGGALVFAAAVMIFVSAEVEHTVLPHGVRAWVGSVVLFAVVILVEELWLKSVMRGLALAEERTIRQREERRIVPRRPRAPRREPPPPAA